ncbi:MAG: ATP-dependent Clp protease ATP-binding subunit ClpX, partial [Oscillospiraceae bacterium]|nr:ATP-dependent Clp protease ATP-binding subunit ClpX [Oscillospiraceae bacterium]
CGGAFDGLDAIIRKRRESNTLGFGAEIKSKSEQEKNIFKDVTPEDLVKFGLVPEIVGRLPVISVLEELDEEALVRILTEPKNALTKQYKKLFELDGIELVFEDEALVEIARRAIKQKTGARGLRAIVEGLLMDQMFHSPSEDVEKVTITAKCVTEGAKPEVVMGSRK